MDYLKTSYIEVYKKTDFFFSFLILCKVNSFLR